MFAAGGRTREERGNEQELDRDGLGRPRNRGVAAGRRCQALPAQNGGGCNMVWHLSQPGGDNMMAGSAHGTGQGAANMFDLLASFSDDHCGLGG
jgi:hypothetical protein